MRSGKTAAARRTLKTVFTSEELLRFPRGRYRLELVKGKLYEMALSGGRHGYISANICAILSSYVQSTDLGCVFATGTGFTLQRDPDTVRAPDAAFVSQGRLPQEESLDGYLELAPDLAVEVISPNDRPQEVREKAADWLNAGTRLVWVIYPSSRTATVHRPPHSIQKLGEEDTLDGADVVLGFSCVLGEIFG